VLTQEVLEEVHRYFGDKLLSTMIRPNVKLAEAPSYAQTVLTYASDSNGAIDYRRLAAEWLGDRVPIEEPVDSDPSGATAPEAEAAPASLAEVLPEAAPSEDRPAPGSAETMSTAEMLAKLADPALPDWSVDTRVRPRGASGRERAPASRATSVWNAPSLLGPLSASELPPHCGSLSSRSRARNRGEPEREPRSAARLERVASDTKAWSLSLS